jgi:ribonuclease P protein component
MLSREDFCCTGVAAFRRVVGATGRLTIDMPARRSLSFPKVRRLTRAWEFERVKQSGCAQRGKLLLLGVLGVENAGRFRAGFVTSRKIGGAVARNRVRRRLREIVRKHQNDLREDFWIVLIARPDATRASYRALEDEWLRLAKRAFILAP